MSREHPSVSAPVRGNTARRTILLLAAVNLVALGSLAAPALAVMPLKLNALLPEDRRAGALAAVLAIGSVAALIANPVIGALSDRTRSRLGRRRPWMLGGALAGLGALSALAAADSFIGIAVAWTGAQVAFNALMAATAALLADSVTERQRGSASGLFTGAAFVGILPPLALTLAFPHAVDAISLIMPLIAVAVVGFAMSIPEASSGPPALVSRGPEPGSRFAVPRTFAAVWLHRLIVQSAFSLAAAFTLYLVIDRMAQDTRSATQIAMLVTIVGGAGIVVGAVGGGAWASRRSSAVPFFAAAGCALACSATVRAVAQTPAMLWIAAALGGLAVGTALAVNLALAIRVAPTSRKGTYLGLLNVAETIPQVLVPLCAAALLRVGGVDPISGASDNYALLYTTAALMALASLLTLPALPRLSGRAGPGS